jgi:hypothetical protein
VPYRICAGRRKFRVCRPIELCVEPSASQDDLRGKAIAEALAQLTLPCPNQYQERQISQAWRIEARQNRLLLAQPSLHPGSFFNHKLTIHDHRYVLRYTRFVEIMMPAFSRAALVLCLPTFRMSVSGWGLDYLWPRCLSFPYKGIAIVDAVVVGHTKQSDPQQGEFYRMLRRFNVDAHAEHDEIVRMHGIDTSYHHQAYGGIRRLNLWKRAFRRLNRCRASGEERQIRENQ